MTGIYTLEEARPPRRSRKGLPALGQRLVLSPGGQLVHVSVLLRLEVERRHRGGIAVVVEMDEGEPALVRVPALAGGDRLRIHVGDHGERRPADVHDSRSYLHELTHAD